MAEKKTVRFKVDTKASAFWIAVDDKDVPLTNGRGNVIDDCTQTGILNGGCVADGGATWMISRSPSSSDRAFRLFQLTL